MKRLLACLVLASVLSLHGAGITVTGTGTKVDIYTTEVPAATITNIAVGAMGTVTNYLYTNLMAKIAAETNRAQIAEAIAKTNALGYLLQYTNTFIVAIYTNSSGGVTNYATTNIVYYRVR